MLRKEAAWLEAELARLPNESLGTVLNIGSGTEQIRCVHQPWINARVIAPLERRGVRIIFHEHAPGPGVDIDGDLMDASMATALRRVGANSVLCCNVLEHVRARMLLNRLLQDLVTPGSYLVVTVPRRFPYHPDPIDSLYRPTIADLAADFPHLVLERGTEVDCETLLSYLLHTGSLRRSLANGVRATLSHTVRRGPRDGIETSPRRGNATEASGSAGVLRYLFSSTAVTCAVLRKPLKHEPAGGQPT